MKDFSGMRDLRVRRLTTVAIALTLFMALDHEICPGNLRTSAAKAFSTSLPLPPQGRTVVINLENKRYIPPPSPLKMPRKFNQESQEPAQLAVRAGDTIRLCNHDQIVYRPFSYSVGNKFGADKGKQVLRPGECMSYVVNNSTNGPIPLKLFDEIHSAQKLFVVVLPTNPAGDDPDPDRCDVNFTGTYARADGTSTITISGSVTSFTATEEWASNDRNGTNNWTKCKVTNKTMTCDWTGKYRGDPDKTADRKGTLSVTLNGATLTGAYHEDEPTFQWNVAPYPSAMHKGATWALELIRQGGPPPPCTPAISSTSSPTAPRAALPITTVGMIRGDVSVRSAGGNFEDLTAGRQLREGDDVSTGPESEVTLTFSDGSTVRVNPMSQVNIASLERERNSVRVRVNLKIGELAAKVNKTKTPEADYSVKTPTAVSSVRGTAFTVRYDERTQMTTVAVQEGTVQVTPNNSSLRSFSLTAGQQVQVAQNRVGPITGANVSTQNLSGTWMMEDGRIVQVTQQGNLVRWNFLGHWNYRGGPGQDKSVGTVSGTFDGKNLVGSYENRDGNVTGKGRVELTLTGNRLEGRWISATTAGRNGRVVMTRQ